LTGCAASKVPITLVPSPSNCLDGVRWELPGGVAADRPALRDDYRHALAVRRSGGETRGLSAAQSGYAPEAKPALASEPMARRPLRIFTRTQPGELLVADTRSCMGDICDEKRQWTFINYVPRLDGRLEEAKHFTQFWVASKFTKQVPVGRCPYDAAARP
jgi:hypothetical protein